MVQLQKSPQGDYEKNNPMNCNFVKKLNYLYKMKNIVNILRQQLLQLLQLREGVNIAYMFDADGR